MLTPVACAVLLFGLVMLIALSVIDLRHMILPNELVLAFALAGVAFHYITDNTYMGWSDMLLGALAGGGMLWGVRRLAFVYYVEDALGLGDVKFMAAAGLWLGVPDIFLALSLGALAGILHGGLVCLFRYLQDRRHPDFKRFSIPAGLGFSVGIVLTGALALL